VEQKVEQSEMDLLQEDYNQTKFQLTKMEVNISTNFEIHKNDVIRIEKKLAGKANDSELINLTNEQSTLESEFDRLKNQSSTNIASQASTIAMLQEKIVAVQNEKVNVSTFQVSQTNLQQRITVLQNEKVNISTFQAIQTNFQQQIDTKANSDDLNTVSSEVLSNTFWVTKINASYITWERGNESFVNIGEANSITKFMLVDGSVDGTKIDKTSPN